jgi:hypothetical protein
LSCTSSGQRPLDVSKPCISGAAVTEDAFRHTKLASLISTRANRVSDLWCLLITSLLIRVFLAYELPLPMNHATLSMSNNCTRVDEHWCLDVFVRCNPIVLCARRVGRPVANTCEWHRDRGSQDFREEWEIHRVTAESRHHRFPRLKKAHNAPCCVAVIQRDRLVAPHLVRCASLGSRRYSKACAINT